MGISGCLWLISVSDSVEVLQILRDLKPPKKENLYPYFSVGLMEPGTKTFSNIKEVVS